MWTDAKIIGLAFAVNRDGAVMNSRQRPKKWSAADVPQFRLCLRGRRRICLTVGRETDRKPGERLRTNQGERVMELQNEMIPGAASPELRALWETGGKMFSDTKNLKLAAKRPAIDVVQRQTAPQHIQ